MRTFIAVFVFLPLGEKTAGGKQVGHEGRWACWLARTQAADVVG